MTIPIRQFGVWQMASRSTPELAEQIEALGFGAIWVGGSPKGDLADVENLLDATRSIPVVTGIVNMWREDPHTVAGSYHRIARRHPDRFLLGVGVGHREATEEYHKPFDKIVAYLDVLRAEGVPEDSLVLAALGPRVLGLAAERTAGAHPYLTTPRHTGFARRVMGDGPLLAPEQKVVLESDSARARAVGRPVVGRYLNRVNYRNNLMREGWTDSDMAEGGSDRLVDALVLHGSAAGIASALRGHLDAGADHVAVQVLGDQPQANYRELAEALFD
jgi:probable F420-dependent oxidoreductase